MAVRVSPRDIVYRRVHVVVYGFDQAAWLGAYGDRRYGHKRRSGQELEAPPNCSIVGIFIDALYNCLRLCSGAPVKPFLVVNFRNV